MKFLRLLLFVWKSLNYSQIISQFKLTSFPENLRLKKPKFVTYKSMISICSIQTTKSATRRTICDVGETHENVLEADITFSAINSGCFKRFSNFKILFKTSVRLQPRTLNSWSFEKKLSLKKNISLCVNAIFFFVSKRLPDRTGSSRTAKNFTPPSYAFTVCS